MLESQRLTLLVFSGVFGLLVGSFLNVCIFRIPRNCMSIVRPRSRCPKCLNLIAWYDNFPVVSWIALGGKCRHCRTPISPRYALVELLTGGLYLFSGWRALYGQGQPGWPQAALFAVETWFVGAMIVCTFIDLEFQILPDEITLSGIVIGLVASAAFPFLHPGPFKIQLWKLVWMIPEGPLASLAAGIAGAAVGGGAIYAVGVLGKYVFRKEAMGLGDVKYMAMVGAVLGWRGVLLTFVIACLLGSIFGIGKYVVMRRMGYVPFGPFLSLGALGMLYGSHLVNRGIRAYMDWIQRLSDHLVR